MVVGINNREHGVVHVPVLIAAREIEKIEFHLLPIRRGLGYHARPVSGVAIVCQDQTIAVQVEHRNRMVVTRRIIWLSYLVHLMHQRVSTGGHAQCDLRLRPVPHIGLRRVDGHRGLPDARQSF